MTDKFDKLQRPEFHKRQVFRVAIAWSGKQSVDSIIGVYENIGTAMDASNAGQVHMTDVMLHTPGIIGGDGRIWITHDGAGSFSAFPDEASARQYLSVNGGNVKSFVLNAVSVKAARGGDMEKASLAAIKDAHSKPQKMLGLKW